MNAPAAIASADHAPLLHFAPRLLLLSEDPAAVLIPKEKRLRDRAHLEFVARQFLARGARAWIDRTLVVAAA